MEVRHSRNSNVREVNFLFLRPDQNELAEKRRMKKLKHQANKERFHRMRKERQRRRQEAKNLKMRRQRKKELKHFHDV